MQLVAPFNAGQYDPSQGAGQMPIGKHKVVIEASQVKPTKGNDGGLVEFTLRVIEGQFAGASGPYRLNLYNASAQAVEIANRQMSALCHVTGIMLVEDTQQLHNIPFFVEVGPQKEKPEYTEVKKVFDINGNEPKNGQGQQQQQQQQQQPQNAMQGQSNPVGGFGSNAPQQPQGQQGQWGQQPQGNQAQTWGQQQPQGPQGGNNGGNAAAAGWNQQQPQNGNAPWGQR